MRTPTTLLFLTFCACTAPYRDPDSATDDFNADTAGDACMDTGADTGNDTGEEPEPEPQMTVDVRWEATGVTITITNGPYPSYQLGVLDTMNEDGWRGEDCLNGMAGFLHCHPLTQTGGTLTTVFDVDLVEPGYTTRHTLAEGTEGALTYALLDPDGSCLATFGHLPDYYVSSLLGCPLADTE